MRFLDALPIVLNLATNNVLEKKDCDNDHTLLMIRKEQLKAIKVVQYKLKLLNILAHGAPSKR
jgi:hypothetical protein